MGERIRKCPSSRKVVDRDSTKPTKSKLQSRSDLGLELKKTEEKKEWIRVGKEQEKVLSAGLR